MYTKNCINNFLKTSEIYEFKITVVIELSGCWKYRIQFYLYNKNMVLKLFYVISVLVQYEKTHIRWKELAHNIIG